MVGLDGTQRSDVHQRLCWRCGYRGPELQGHRARVTFFCPSCGEDLYARPPMSYMEREGFARPTREIVCIIERLPVPAERRRIRMPSARFAVSALFVSVSAAGLLAVVMAMYAN